MNNLVHRPASAATTKGLIAMGRIVELASIKPRSTSRPQGLRKLSPDLISKARDETATQVTRVGLTFLGTVAFCLLSLLSPDSALLGGNERINVPLAGPVSFFGFMLLGPTVLIVLRVYLQIYVEHSDRLDRLARSVSAVRAPTLVPLRNPLIRVLSGLTFYLLLPVAMMLFAWKAAVFPDWGAGLLCVATGVVVSHVMLPFSRFSWRSKALLSVAAAVIAGLLLSFGPMRRPFDLYHANLSGQWLAGLDLRNANLRSANLSGANLIGAKLSGATLSVADLSGARLSVGDLSNANLSSADLSNADLTGATLSNADLSNADLSNAKLFDANLSDAKLFLANLSDATLLRVNLTGADMRRATLRKANLPESNLGDANLSNAKLGGATLMLANLSNADLSNADLSNAGLMLANLSNADLSNADLSNAELILANLSNANLSNAKKLTQTQLNGACGDANTKLPTGLTLKPCETDSLFYPTR
jgi:uncharacterized protein YjbI with pentapeptide repeats